MIIVPVYEKILAPNSTLFLTMDQLKRSAGNNGVAVNERIVILVAKENCSLNDLNEDSFYPIGVSGTVKEMYQRGYAVIQTQHRVNVESVTVNPDHTIQLAMSRRPEIEDLNEATEAGKLKHLKDEIKKFVSGFDWGDSVKYFVDRVDSIGTAICMMSRFMQYSNEEMYAVLAEDSKAKRTELMEKMLYEFMEVGRIANEAATSQQQEIQQRYKESAIKRQMEHLQRELDEMHPENVTDVQKFARRIENAGMNETARKEAEKVLNRLKQEGKEGAESAMLYDYLDFVTTLSWKKEATERIDLKEAQRVLDEEHYGLKKVKDRIIQQIAVMNLKNQQSGSILLFVGAPGTGKTSIGRSIAHALGREYVRVSLGGVHDESDIRGHRRTYIGAMPGRIMDGIHKSGVSNPVMVLDEVDKMSASYNGSPASALLEVLDPEQNNTFTDHYMNVPYDLSDVLFICTANSLDTIPQPLLDRMEVIQFQGYTPAEKMQIAKKHLVSRSMETMGITDDKMQITDEALEMIISQYTMEAGVRGLRKQIDGLCRSMAVKIALEPDTFIKVTPETVQEEIETRPIRHDSILPEPSVGVVTGLAWTSVGGEILYIETKLIPGSGKAIITGQLGDVMKESAQIALSLVKSLFPEEAKQLEDHDLHIHVPAGATPKDGPSAGVTLTTAIASLITGRVVDPHIAMTGEVALRGAVMPIGGLPEKLMAAQRAGVNKVFIPEENLFDLKDVAQEVKDCIEIVPVKHVTDILKATGILE
jgi:ATP-dependent Lon protease